MHPDEVLATRLEERFSSWGVKIDGSPGGPSNGAVRQSGGSGLIRYAFGENERGRYIEYYSFHRIGGDSHGRIYATGEFERLEAVGTSYITTGDPEEDRQSREKLRRYNAELLAELEEAGLLSGGPVPRSFEINTALVMGAIDPDEEPEVGERD